MRFVVVTGMSGSGKTQALKMLEDMGYFCVDNLPLELTDKFAELAATPAQEYSKVALGLDVSTHCWKVVIRRPHRHHHCSSDSVELEGLFKRHV